MTRKIDNQKQFNVTADSAIIRRIKVYCAEHEISTRTLFEQAITKFLDAGAVMLPLPKNITRYPKSPVDLALDLLAKDKNANQ